MAKKNFVSVPSAGIVYFLLIPPPVSLADDPVAVILFQSPQRGLFISYSLGSLRHPAHRR